MMGMSATKRAEASERMKTLHATGKLKKKIPGATHDRFTGEELPDPGKLRKAMTENFKAELNRTWSLSIDVDWVHLAMPEAQQAYAQLKKEFERAGFILNQRSMPTPGRYLCFMCGTAHLGEPRMKDASYQNAESGLMEIVQLCGEFCCKFYQDFRIALRVLTDRKLQHVITDEEYVAEHLKTLEEIRGRARSKA